MAKKNKKKVHAKKRRFHRVRRLIKDKNGRVRMSFIFPAFTLLGIFLFLLIWIFWDLPIPSKLGDENFAVSTKILDRNGKLIYEIYGNQRRTPISLEDLPVYVKDATISIEDKDFYSHRGFSVTGIVRAVRNILFENKLQGGSTITQQLVKNSLLTSERTVRRKVREFALSIVVETIYSKDEILEMYLNQIPYGGTAYGIEAASETYFGKAAKDLSLAEAAYLAGLPASPSTYSPFGAHPELAKGRQETVLRLMVEEGKISQEDADKAKEEELKIQKVENLKAPHFALWIKQQLAEKFGERMTEQGGLRVTTTLDLDLQEFAEAAVATEVAKLDKQKVGNGAAIVTHPATGEILAMVGSKDYFAEDEDGKVNIIFAQRQPGSSIKPLNYALAIKDGKLSASSPLADVPTCFGVVGQRSYCPVNYDGSFHGAQQLRYSLGNSLNIPAVRVLALNGVEHFMDFAKTMGITTFRDPANYGLSLTLGGGEVRPYDMATAFGVFANEGIKQPLVSILKVEDWKGKVLEETNSENITLSGDRVLEPEVAFIISDILKDNDARTLAFGPSSFLNVSAHPEVSVKTGTTNDRRDNWTIGYTSQILVATWVGNNDNSPMGGAVSGVSGASPIWNRIMKEALSKAEEGFYSDKDKGHGGLAQPDSVVGANVCTSTGNVPEGSPEQPNCATRFEYFTKEKVGAALQSGSMDMTINKSTGAIANPNPTPTPSDPNNPDSPPLPFPETETQSHPFLIDPLGTLVCLDCPPPDWSAVIGYPLKQ